MSKFEVHHPKCVETSLTMFGWPGWGIIFTFSPWNPTAGPSFLAQARIMERENGEAVFYWLMILKKGVYWVIWVWNHSDVFFWNNVTLDSWHHFYLMVTVPVHMMMNLGVPWHALMIIFRKRLMFFLGLIVSVNCIMFFWSHHLNGPGSSWTSLLLHRTLAFAICMECPEN